MDEPRLDPETNLTEQKPKIIGPDGQPMTAKWVTLGIEKFSFPVGKHYRLIWTYMGRAWLAEEDATHFRRVRDAVAAGKALAERVRCLHFNEVAR
jgi:hypothetical protein